MSQNKVSGVYMPHREIDMSRVIWPSISPSPEVRRSQEYMEEVLHDYGAPNTPDVVEALKKWIEDGRILYKTELKKQRHVDRSTRPHEILPEPEEEPSDYYYGL